jgi:threonine aldolase
MIELRSDTFTLPTPAMRRAMAEAEVGDDVYGEDPTVVELEHRSAEAVGKEAACLMPSGTMANLAALLAAAPRGSKILVGARSDLYVFEAGGASVCGGLVYEPLPNQTDGTIRLSDLSRALPDDPGDPQFAVPAVVCLEDTHNATGGKVLPPGYLASVRAFADEHRLWLHLDGARIFNAAVARGVPVADVAKEVDSVQFCLSKGLGAPVGSMLSGSAAFVSAARRVRKMLGGGMRQAGIIAAAGLVALREVDRIAEDHVNARRLAEGLAGIEGVHCDPAAVQTNIVMFKLARGSMPHAEFCERAAAEGIGIAELGAGTIRAVTHRDVAAADIDQAIAAITGLLKHS